MCILAKNYWKLLLPCPCPPASRGRTAQSISWDQRKTTKTSYSAERLSYACVTVYASKLSEMLVLPKARPTLLSDRQMHGKVLFRRNRNAMNVLPVVTGTCGTYNSVQQLMAS